MVFADPNAFLSWSEPFGFGFREIGMFGVIWRLLFFISVAVLFAGLLLFDAPEHRPRPGIIELIAIPLLIATLFTGMLTAPHAIRFVSISKQGVNVSHPFVMFLAPWLWFVFGWSLNKMAIDHVDLEGQKASDSIPTTNRMLRVVPKHGNTRVIAVGKNVSETDLIDAFDKLEIKLVLK